MKIRCFCMALLIATAVGSTTNAQTYDHPGYDRNQRQSNSDEMSRDGSQCHISGLTLTKADGQNQGLTVVDVRSNSPAANANIRRGDVIVKVDGEEIRTIDEWNRTLQSQQRDSSEVEVPIKLQRDDRTQQVSLRLNPSISPSRQMDDDQRLTGRDANNQRTDGDRQRSNREGGYESDRDSQSSSEHGALGVSLDSNYQGNGVRVKGVYRNSSASRAGIQPGDIILKINQQPVREVDEIVRRIKQMNPDQRVDLTIQSEGRQEEVDVVLGRRAEELQGPLNTAADNWYSSNQRSNDQRVGGNQPYSQSQPYFNQGQPYTQGQPYNQGQSYNQGQPYTQGQPYSSNRVQYQSNDSQYLRTTLDEIRTELAQLRQRVNALESPNGSQSDRGNIDRRYDGQNKPRNSDANDNNYRDDYSSVSRDENSRRRENHDESDRRDR